MKIGFFSTLALIFITLKLTGVIAWSWWLVLLPLYGLFTIIFVGMFIAFAFGYSIDEIQKWSTTFRK